MRCLSKSLILVSITIPALTGCGSQSPRTQATSSFKEAWNAANDPVNLRDAYEVHLASLPSGGTVARAPWTDTYWPSSRGGIADRWNDQTSPSAFDYKLAKKNAVKNMTLAARAKLSPAEKYDIYMGRFDYPLVNEERQRTSPDDAAWFGLCHGWAPAAINFEEPQPVTVASADGIELPFGSSDVKALLTFAQQYGEDDRTVGERCNHDLAVAPDHANDPECRDTNAGSFHIIIANQLGLLQKAFVAEVNRDYQIWNQPVYGFESKVISVSGDVYAGAAPGTVKIASVRTEMNYVSELGADWDPRPVAAFPSQLNRKTYEYMLELDADGAIIGGEWKTHGRPDFLWTQEAPLFTGYLAGVKELYEAARP